MASNRQPQPWNDASVHEFGRDFLAFSVQHGIYCVPIDDVSSCRTQYEDDMVGTVSALLYKTSISPDRFSLEAIRAVMSANLQAS